MAKCIKCGREDVVFTPDCDGEPERGGRYNCAGCKRLVGYSAASVAAPEEIREPAPEFVPLAPAADWLYTSKRLDLVWLPNVRFYAQPVIWFGDRPHFRLTPSVYRWLLAAGDRLDEQLAAKLAGGLLTREQAMDQGRCYAERMAEVGRFVSLVYPRDAVAAARAELPSVAPPPPP